MYIYDRIFLDDVFFTATPENEKNEEWPANSGNSEESNVSANEYAADNEDSPALDYPSLNRFSEKATGSSSGSSSSGSRSTIASSARSGDSFTKV